MQAMVLGTPLSFTNILSFCAGTIAWSVMIYTTAHPLAVSISQKRWTPQGPWWDDIRRPRSVKETLVGILPPFLGGPSRTTRADEQSTQDPKRSKAGKEVKEVNYGPRGTLVGFLMHLCAYCMYVNAAHSIPPDAAAIVLCSIPLAVPGRYYEEKPLHMLGFWLFWGQLCARALHIWLRDVTHGHTWDFFQWLGSC